MEVKVHHYGLATNNIKESIKTFEALGFAAGQTHIDPKQNVQLTFISCGHGPLIELISDLDDNGPTRKMIEKSGNGLYHICFEVDDMEAAINSFREEGYLLRHKPVEAVAFNGRKIAWMYNRSIGLVELLESEKIKK